MKDPEKRLDIEKEKQIFIKQNKSFL